MKIDYSKPKTVMTLCVLRKGDDLLMGMKKVRFGRGNYNGYGGKVGPGESMEECLIREIKEESGLDLLKFEKRGVMTFELVDSVKEVHIFEGISWIGEAIESEEMAPIWFHKDDLPFDKMWSSDKFWYPYFFNRDYFEGWLIFDENHQVLDSEIHKIDKNF